MNASEVVIVGMGQLGQELSRGFEALGLTVVPVRRGDSITDIATRHPAPRLVFIAVGEDDLHPVLEQLPPAYRSRLALLQNELRPEDWRRHALPQPTVAVIWFEKKADKPRTVLLETPVAGPSASLVVEALDAIGVPARVVSDEALPIELAAKNLYILATNLLGRALGGGPVGPLFEKHRARADALIEELARLEEAALGARLPREPMLETLERAIASDPSHGSEGRSAPRRLARTRALAARLGLSLPELSRVPD